MNHVQKNASIEKIGKNLLITKIGASTILYFIDKINHIKTRHI